MVGKINYKVLWVEDDESNIKSYSPLAGERRVSLDVASDWETAEKSCVFTSGSIQQSY